MLLDYLKKIPDVRTREGRMFDLPHTLLFSILAIASGADSYRKIAIFIEENFIILQKNYLLNWKRPPCYNSIRHIIHGLDLPAVEKVFREYSKMAVSFEKEKLTVVGLDGKALRHSFDNMADLRFKQMLSAFAPEARIILAHASIGMVKDHEINAALKLLKALPIDHALYTLDALHTQKKR